KNRLPDYMIPASLVPIESFPLTAHGKLDVQRLPASAQPDRSKGYEPPEDEKQAVLARVWKEVLGAERVGATDNFFDLGGDSIRAIQLRARAEQAGIAFSIQQLFATPTVRDLAAANVESDHNRPATLPFGLISKSDRERLGGDVEDAYPLSSLQM